MRFSTAVAAVALALASTHSFAANDQEKAQREIAHINALASDPTVRPTVNKQIATLLQQDRVQMVVLRKEHALTYGDLFLLHEVAPDQHKFDELVAQASATKHAGQIADEQKPDWKKVLADAKRFEKTLENAIYDSMAPTTKPVKAETSAYDARKDWFTMDPKSYTNDDLAWALKIFVAAKERAERTRRQQGLSDLDYGQLHTSVDHVNSGLSGSSGTVPSSAPTPH